MGALYLKANPKIDVARDSGYKQILWQRKDDSLNQIIRTDLTEQSSGVLVLTPSGGATPSRTIPLGSMTTGNFLHLQCDQEVTLVFNGGAETLTVKGLGTYPGFITLHGEFTAIVVANQSAAESCEVDYLLLGV